MAAPAGFSGPELQAAGFISFDGARLAMQTWAPPDSAKPRAVIVALHGMNDYSEAFYLAGPWWAERGIKTYAYDARGFGLSPNRGLWAGERLLTEDLRTLTRLVRAAHPQATLAVVGDSMGAATAMAAFGSGDPPVADRLVLVAPAVWGWKTLPDLYALTLRVGAHTFPWRAVTPPRGVQRRITPSDNIEMLRKISRDPNMLFDTRIDAIYGLVSLMQAAANAAPRLKVPTAFLYGAKDQIVPRASAIAAAKMLPKTARTAVYPNGYHMLLRDLGAETVYADVARFLEEPAAPWPSSALQLAET